MAAFQNFIIMPMTFLSGVFYSVHSLPPFWQAVSHLNPFFYMIDGFRRGFFGASDVSPWLCLAVVGTSFVAVAALALRLLTSGYKLQGLGRSSSDRRQRERLVLLVARAAFRRFRSQARHSSGRCIGASRRCRLAKARCRWRAATLWRPGRRLHRHRGEHAARARRSGSPSASSGATEGAGAQRARRRARASGARPGTIRRAVASGDRTTSQRSTAARVVRERSGRPQHGRGRWVRGAGGRAQRHPLHHPLSGRRRERRQFAAHAPPRRPRAPSRRAMRPSCRHRPARRSGSAAHRPARPARASARCAPAPRARARPGRPTQGSAVRRAGPLPAACIGRHRRAAAASPRRARAKARAAGRDRRPPVGGGSTRPAGARDRRPYSRRSRSGSGGWVAHHEARGAGPAQHQVGEAADLRRAQPILVPARLLGDLAQRAADARHDLARVLHGRRIGEELALARHGRLQQPPGDPAERPRPPSVPGRTAQAAWRLPLRSSRARQPACPRSNTMLQAPHQPDEPHVQPRVAVHQVAQLVRDDALQLGAGRAVPAHRA